MVLGVALYVLPDLLLLECAGATRWSAAALVLPGMIAPVQRALAAVGLYGPAAGKAESRRH